MLNCLKLKNIEIKRKTEDDTPEVPVTSAPVPAAAPTDPEPVVASNDTVEEDIDDLLKDL